VKREQDQRGGNESGWFPRRGKFGTGFSSGFVMVDTGVPEYSPFLRFFDIN
jgi:hypothetical protein